MRSNNSKSLQASSTMNMTTPDGSIIVWGFMFENTLFTEFEPRNHPIIEAAYRQRKKKHTSHYITITDSNLPKPSKAKVYFGVAQNHLRMPGTRYYVNRQVIRPTTSESSPRPPLPVIIPSAPPVSSPYSLPVLIPSPTSTFSSSSFSSLDTSLLYPITHNVMHQNQQQINDNTLAVPFTDDLPLIDLGNYNNLFNENLPMDFNQQCNDYNANDNLGMTVTFHNGNVQSHRSDYINHYVPANSTTPYSCSCLNPDFNIMFENQSWVNDLFSLGLLP